MKPRLRCERGVWVCRSCYLTLSGKVKVEGDGYTPIAAYREWQEQLRRMTRV